MLRSLYIILFTCLPCYGLLMAQGGFRKKYFLNNSLTSACRDVIEAPNGNLIMCGITVDTLGTQKLTIVGAGANGNLLWRKDYGHSGFRYLDNDYHMRGPVIYDANGFYHAISFLDSSNRTFGALIKFDYLGDSLWQKIYRIEAPKDVILQGLCRSLDGGFLITGASQNWGSDGGDDLPRD